MGSRESLGLFSNQPAVPLPSLRSLVCHRLDSVRLQPPDSSTSLSVPPGISQQCPDMSGLFEGHWMCGQVSQPPQMRGLVLPFSRQRLVPGETVKRSLFLPLVPTSWR